MDIDNEGSASDQEEPEEDLEEDDDEGPGEDKEDYIVLDNISVDDDKLDGEVDKSQCALSSTPQASESLVRPAASPPPSTSSVTRPALIPMPVPDKVPDLSTESPLTGPTTFIGSSARHAPTSAPVRLTITLPARRPQPLPLSTPSLPAPQEASQALHEGDKEGNNAKDITTDGMRCRRRKANVLNLNACICGITITDREIQDNETVMMFRVPGCETVWVSEPSIQSSFMSCSSLFSSQFHMTCMDYEFIPQQWSCDSCKAGSSRRRRY